MFYLWYKGLLILLSSILTISVGCNDPETVKQANTYYKNRLWQQAIPLYESLPTKGAGIWYNLGNCFFYTQQIPRSLVCWYKAYKNAPAPLRPHIYHALEQITPSNKHYVWQKIVAFSWHFSLFALQCWILLLWYAAWYLLFRSHQKRFKLLGIIVGIVALLLLAIFIDRYYNEYKTQAVVTSLPAAIKSGPGHQYKTVDTLQKATRVHIKQAQDSWRQINYGGKDGWINEDMLTLI